MRTAICRFAETAPRGVAQPTASCWAGGSGTFCGLRSIRKACSQGTSQWYGVVDTVSTGPSAGARRLGVAAPGRGADADAEGDPDPDADADPDGDEEALALGDADPVVAVPDTDAEVPSAAPADRAARRRRCPTRGSPRAPRQR